MSSSIDDLEKGAYLYQEKSVSDNEAERNRIRQNDTHKTPCTLSSDGETVYLGGMAIDRNDLARVLPYQQQPTTTVVKYEQTNFRPLGNPIPLGLAGFAISTFTLGLVLLEARGATNPKLLISSSLTLSGLGTMISGLWCFLLDNTFIGTALAAFGGFYLSYAVILIDSFGIASSYSTTEEMNNVMGIWLAAWVIFAAIMWALTWKAPVELSVLIWFIFVFLLLLDIHYFTGVVSLKKASGAFAVLSSFTAFYVVWALQATEETSLIIPRVVLMPGSKMKSKRF